MNRKFSFLLTIPIVIGIAIIVWSLLTGIMAESTFSMSMSVSLETTNLQHSLVGNNTVSFEMTPNSQGDLTLSVENNGTVALKDVTLYIDHISNGLSLSTSGNPLHPPITRYIGSMDRRDSAAYGWTLLSAYESGDYEIDFRVVSDRVVYWFTVVINVHT